MVEGLFRIPGDASTLKKRILRALAKNRWIDESKMSVSVEGSIVQIDGVASSAAQKLLAEREALAVPGVRQVRNGVKVIQTQSQNNIWIAGEILQCFSLCLGMNLSRVFVKVQNGVAYIRGTVPTARLKLAAETVTRTIPQVLGVVNELEVDPRLINNESLLSESSRTKYAAEVLIR